MTDDHLSAQSWQAYWRGTQDARVYGAGGVSHPAIEGYWFSLLKDIKTVYSKPTILDVGAGHGTMIEICRDVFDPNIAITGVDISPAAIDRIKARFPDVEGIVADAREMSLERKFDLVISQFGSEYAGVEGIRNAAAYVVDNGVLALMLHHDASLIHRESSSNLAAIRGLIASGFIQGAIKMVKAGFAAMRGEDRAPYDAAARALQPAVKAVENVMREYGEGVAGGTVAELYRGFARIHTNLMRHDEQEVIEWLEKFDEELEGYEGRMSSMLAAALDEQTFHTIVSDLAGEGFSVSVADMILPGEGQAPLAWVLVARRGEKLPTSIGQGPAGTPDASFEERHDEDEEVDRGKLDAWVHESLDVATRELVRLGVVEDQFFEAKPAWVYPFRILIGKIRKPADTGSFKWFIYGDVPTDWDDHAVASTPRDAARHFSMKWQLAAEGDETERQKLIDNAEFLYELSEAENLWR